MNRAQFASIAKDTVRISRIGYYPDHVDSPIFTNVVKKSIANTQLITPQDSAELVKTALKKPITYTHSVKTNVELTNESTLSAILRLAQSPHNNYIGVLNFASARNPGGGFLNGSMAQEESLAIASSLFLSLNHRKHFQTKNQ